MAVASVQNDRSALLDSLNGTAGNPSAGNIGEVQDRFLKLLVTQLKNQDPMNPMQNAELTSQLAQMSTVEGVNRLNDTLATLLDGYHSSQTLQAASLIGRQVLVEGDGLSLAQGKAAGGMELSQAVDRLTVDILDRNKQVLRTLTLGPQAAGLAYFEWDGRDISGKALPDGDYRFAVNAWQDGERIAATTLALDRVGSVIVRGGALQLELSGQEPQGLDRVRQIF